MLEPQATKRINIAIDGYAGCGKSTLAKGLARRLQYTYVDSGAMYRVVALYAIENNISPGKTRPLIRSLKQVRIRFDNAMGTYRTLLNGTDVTEAIRSNTVNAIVSDIAAISEVRTFLVAQQREMGKDKGVVMDGRDIGTVVFPGAELKIFLTADVDVRAQRRMREMQSKGRDVAFTTIKASLIKRDHIDMTREDSPLKKAEDAIELDNTDLTRKEQLDIVYEMAKARIDLLTKG